MKRAVTREGSRPRIAMVICIRDEARFLAANLLYHRAIGVERAYVYLDRCADASEEIASAFPWVNATRVAAEDGARFDYVPDMQAACMDRALRDARNEGFDWLLTLDADEFAIANNPESDDASRLSACDRGDLRCLLAGVRDDTEMVRLISRELLPLNLDPSEPFWNQQYFLIDPTYRRDMLDPIDGTVKRLTGYLGHAYGKAIVRTSADVQAFNPHEWTRNQEVSYPVIPGRSQLRVEFRGQHLHYAVVDWAQWLDKNRKFNHEPSRWRMGGEVPFPKQCWKEAAPRLSDEEAQAYFRDWVAAPEHRIHELVAKRQVIHDDIVEQVLRDSGVLTEAGLQLPREPRPETIEDWKMPESFWPKTPKGVTQCSDGEVRYSVPDLPLGQIQGLFGPFYNGRERYRLAKREAAVAVDLPPREYDVTVHMHQWNAHSLSISLDERTVDARVRPNKQGTVTVRLSERDFAATDIHRLQVELHPTAWQRLVGKPASTGFSSISFEPRHRAA